MAQYKPMTKRTTPQTGQFYAFRASGNVAKLGAANGDNDGFHARYTDGPSKGQQVVLSVKFLRSCGVVV